MAKRACTKEPQLVPAVKKAASKKLGVTIQYQKPASSQLNQSKSGIANQYETPASKKSRVTSESMHANSNARAVLSAKAGTPAPVLVLTSSSSKTSPKTMRKLEDARAVAPATPVADVNIVDSHIAFLRLNTHCQPSMTVEKLVYLNRHEVTFGRAPTCNVVLDSSRAPQMISRIHGCLRRLLNDDGQEEWLLKDNKSMNGILVNGDPIGEEGCKLKVGDAITFGRRMIPPEFEFVFETTKAQIMSQSPSAQEEKVLKAAQEDKVLNAQEKKISELQNELEEERARTRAMTQRRKSRVGAMDDFQGELFCSICNDWLVNSSTITCSHTFCWACIDAWLVQKKFECPVCRQVVSREPIRSKALDTIVRKTVDRLTTTEKEDYISRVTVASLALEKAENLHAELRLGVDEALEKGKAFFSH